MPKSKKDVSIRSGAAEYLTYVASNGGNTESFEILYQDEDIWITQKMMAKLYDVSKSTISEHISKVFSDSELDEESTVRKFRTVQTEGNVEKGRYLKHYNLQMIIAVGKRLDLFLAADDREVLQDAGKITAEIARQKAESEFEKYRVIQDKLFMSDYDKYLLEIEKSVKENK